ncbi:SDR family oxidoreductase [Microlunatus parietis]|uniref:Nucleoside-diphosphate-sugar epimerase n=1 Tax=Microlunatus parietis TaxID=682979 RepID=A0A7Y9I6I0_9ACTN|nr:SDR family oxidoreductase [Microlunatus parietis]NYE71208.1 nucleoside-diphosphate-sugar epimerase [Microlunatus parietis]
MTLSVLFLGGTGTISSWCARRAVDAGITLTVLNRGTTTRRPLPERVEELRGNARDPDSVRAAIGDRRFDVVVDFVAFLPEHVAADIEVFRGRTGQFIFISSASAYQKPVGRLPITESTPLHNPFWKYSRDKIACEELLINAYRSEGFPAIIVRPSHTYDDLRTPLLGGHADIDRMRAGRPVLVHGDGTSLWTLTHSSDFAVAFTGLLGDRRTVGDAFTITSDEALTWDQVYRAIGAAAGAEPDLVHVSSETIARYAPSLGPGLLGDKAHSVVFDNTKIKSVVPSYVCTVPYAEGARRIVAAYDADPSLATPNQEFEAVYDALVGLATSAP